MGSNKSIKIAVDIQVLIDAYQSGMSIRTIAKQYGCSFQNVNARLWNAGIVPRPTGSVRKLPDRICPTCQTIFRPHASSQRFCCLEHVRIKETCVRGHLLTEENRYHFPGSASRCKQCQAIRNKAYSERKK